MVTFHRNATKRYNSVCNGKTNEMGRFQMSTYRGFDGAAGNFDVTVTKAIGVDEEGEPVKNQLPEGTARRPLAAQGDCRARNQRPPPGDDLEITGKAGASQRDTVFVYIYPLLPVAGHPS